MKRLILGISCLFFLSAQAQDKSISKENPKIILLITEQNIEGPQKAWWASEIDLSSTEATIARRLIEEGYEVLEPPLLFKTIKNRPAFRLVEISDEDSLDLGKILGVDYVILGKAVASSGGGALKDTNFNSYFANITVKVLKVKEKRIWKYLEANAKSLHIDRISGGKEALDKASQDLAEKIIAALRGK